MICVSLAQHETPTCCLNLLSSDPGEDVITLQRGNFCFKILKNVTSTFWKSHVTLESQYSITSVPYYSTFCTLHLELFN